MHDTYSSWIEISKSAFEHNIQQFRSCIGPTILFAPVIKSNAYGHGMLLIAQLCEQNPQVHWLCVASLSEAVFLRNHGIKKPLLVLSILDNALERSITHSIKIMAHDLETIFMLNELGKYYNKKVEIHIKIDTGLSRAGFLWHAAVPTIQKINRLSHITIDGIFSHLANAESMDQSYAYEQIERFTQLLGQLRDAHIVIPHTHVSCSAAVLTNLGTQRFSLSRAGISIYGLWPSPETKIKAQHLFPHLNLYPIMRWKTKIIHIKTVPADTSIGYDLTFTTKRKTTLALLPIGYWDGYDRTLSNKGLVKIRDHYAPVLGRVAMNLTVIDITDIDNVQHHDEVILLGDDHHIHADTIAQTVGTINYEIVTRINPLLPRILVS